MTDSSRVPGCRGLRLIAAWIALLCSHDALAGTQKLNILLIIVDDLAPVVSAYGGPVSTPSIDHLAQQGIRFTNNYANVPVCGASRASMLSGIAPGSARFLSYDSRLDADVPGAVSMPAYFREHGWHTVANGKVFDVIADSSESWSEPVWSPQDDWYGKPPNGRGEHLQAAFIKPIEEGRLPYFERLPVADSAYPDGQVAEKTAADLQRLSAMESPFFIAVGFRKPHLPFNAPDQYWESAQSPAAQLPVTWRKPAAGVPGVAFHQSPELRRQYDALPWIGQPDDDVAVDIVRAYHAAVRYADAQIGRVLNALESSDAADNTVVVLMGDHGFLLGEQRMWTKHALFEPALRTPLIITRPGGAGGAQSMAVTDLLDVYPTLADLAGLPMPEGLDGVSLRGLMDEPELPHRTAKQGSVSRWMNGESIRQLNFRYTRWFDESGETTDAMLFDLAVDPHEQVNLAERAEYAHLITDLERTLALQRSGPVWSEQLGKQAEMWQLASSSSGTVLMYLLAHRWQVGLLILALVVVLGVVVVRRRRAMHGPNLTS